ncbi:RagB/SusD family nutrient uptake outer membrane protein [Pedobacter psychroterrae]|uniref:RagB/SusD family nutrient uptake outer membrane protein n=1 Tax=Pedobacter psychroterrae TaxID=2530453 RepID=A0A4R0NM08_9SPHI|nr:RagB/SusD family nutrient uptake outer membrane protein [Pedobacter psychroterrae]TCD00344.1 RagB/SusD family nutrient uptake outer membrane protein [Pedobacter psychroterrae]
MKKKYMYLAVVALAIQLTSSCKDSLEVNPSGRITLDNYYKTEADAFAALVSVYDRFGFQASGLYDKIAIMDVASDDHFAGGGSATDINDLQVVSNYSLSANVGPQGYLWNRGYSGIFRANTLLAKIADIPMAEAQKNRFVAETKTLRALFYFDLLRFFENIPIIDGVVDPKDLYNVAQSNPSDVYTFIEKDLTEAIPNLPATVVLAEGGRITKGAAQATLGKVYLWQKKYSEAAEQLAIVNGSTPGQVNATYGYKLINNFSDLWKPANKFNSESILEVTHSASSQGSWNDAGAGEGNLLSIISGPRGYATLKPGAPDYHTGYGFLIITKNLFDLIHYDPRNQATVANLDSLKSNGIANYQNSYQNTGYFLEKFAGRVSTRTTVPSSVVDLNFGYNTYEIRLADTYLLEAEALMSSNAAVGAGSRAYQLLNAVRARVGLSPVPVTLETIEKERRLELAGEGHRWLDLIRWGKAAAVLGPLKGFVAGKHEVFPIPQNELNNTKIEQNKEWGGSK